MVSKTFHPTLPRAPFWPTLCQASDPNNTGEHCSCCFGQVFRSQPHWTGQKGPGAGPIIFSGLKKENLASRDINQHVLSPHLFQQFSLPGCHVTSKLLQEVSSIPSIVWVMRLREMKLIKLMQFASGRIGVLGSVRLYFFHNTMWLHPDILPGPVLADALGHLLQSCFQNFSWLRCRMTMCFIEDQDALSHRERPGESEPMILNPRCLSELFGMHTHTHTQCVCAQQGPNWAQLNQSPSIEPEHLFILIF